MMASVASNDDTLFLSTLEMLLLSMLGETMEKIVVGVEFVVEISIRRSGAIMSFYFSSFVMIMSLCVLLALCWTCCDAEAVSNDLLL